MMGMANSSNIIKGSFTISTEADSTYVINIGKSLTNYLVYIEMTPESIAKLASTASSTVRKAYAIIGIMNFPEIAGGRPSIKGLAATYRTSDGSRSASSYNLNASDTQISNYVVNDDYSEPGIYLYRGYTYNYQIIPID